MQINAHFHRSRFASLAAMFDPAANVDYAARFLKALKAREGSWTLAVASGFGGWTANARALCQ